MGSTARRAIRSVSRAIRKLSQVPFWEVTNYSGHLFESVAFRTIGWIDVDKSAYHHNPQGDSTF
jgi:hypothetical protein